ncbi:MAG: DUF2065 domain-containing protein [Gammaproteobacteria bacterium]|nr:DUF2065 domain-containing protein [Gammaproteobacteria bacterium]
MWHDLLAAFCLYLVIEGLFPFLNPQGLREALLALTELPDRAIRLAGLASMVAGTLLLYLIK